MSRPEELSTDMQGECLVVTVPLAMKRRRGRKEIITPGGQGDTELAPPRTNAALALTLARAHRWRTLLEEGRYASIRELALALGVDNSYVARLLRLTLLAPDLVEAILEGTEPSGLSLEQLYRAPLGWERQRQEVGSLRQQLVRGERAGQVPAEQAQRRREAAQRGARTRRQRREQ